MIFFGIILQFILFFKRRGCFFKTVKPVYFQSIFQINPAIDWPRYHHFLFCQKRLQDTNFFVLQRTTVYSKVVIGNIH